jgi:hypothetical protein
VGLVAAGFSIERNGKDRLVRPILWNKKKGVSFMRNAFANLKQKAPRAGFEPATYRLTAGRSAVELPRKAGRL